VNKIIRNKMSTKNQSKLKKFFIRRAKRSWIIAIGIVIALIVGGIYIAPDLIRKVRQGLAAKTAVEHVDWSGGPGELITTDPYTTKYDKSYNIDTSGGEEGIKLKTLDQGATASDESPSQLPTTDVE